MVAGPWCAINHRSRGSLPRRSLRPPPRPSISGEMPSANLLPIALPLPVSCRLRLGAAAVSRFRRWSESSDLNSFRRMIEEIRFAATANSSRK